MTDASLITFKAIANFSNCLDEVFGEEQRSLKLYAHLINKTTIAHEKPILKHMKLFLMIKLFILIVFLLMLKIF
jgi:hypothetical protein